MTSRSSLSAGLNAPVKRLAPITFPNDGRLLVIDPANFREARFWMVSGLPTINPQRWCEAAFQPHCDGIHQVACPELCLKALLSRRDTCIALPQTYI
jgi:hypothetical protein